MEHNPKRTSIENLSPEERKRLVWMQMQAETIREFVLMPERFIYEQQLELNDLLNESSDVFLPENNTENLKPYCYDFMEIIKAAEQRLASEIAENMKNFVGKHSLTEEMIRDWIDHIEEVKSIIIPRLKKQGLNDAIKLLEGAIMQSEIMIAYNKN